MTDKNISQLAEESHQRSREYLNMYSRPDIYSQEQLEEAKDRAEQAQEELEDALQNLE